MAFFLKFKLGLSQPISLCEKYTVHCILKTAGLNNNKQYKTNEQLHKIAIPTLAIYKSMLLIIIGMSNQDLNTAQHSFCHN